MSIGKSGRWILSLFGVKKSPSLPQVDCSLEGGKKEAPAKRGGKEKRRWSLGGRKASSTAQFEVDHNSPAEWNDYISGRQAFEMMEKEQDQQKSKHAMVVAAASAAAAEAALAAASAAAAVARLTANGLAWNEFRTSVSMDRELAAIKIQTAFRGHLARRALRALKAVVRLQALFRGQKVRKQAATTLQCMQALVKVQSRARARALANARSQAGLPKEAHVLQHQFPCQRQRNQQARPKKSAEEGKGGSGRKDKLQAKGEKKQQAAMKCEEALPRETKHPNTPGWSWIERWMVGRSPVLQNQKGGKAAAAAAAAAAAVGMERSSEASSRTFGPNRSFRSKSRMGSTADSFSFDLNTSSSLNSTAIHTSPSPLVESFRSTDRSPANRILALKQRPPNSIAFVSTPSLSWRSRATVGGLRPSTRSHIWEHEEYDSSSSADSSLAFSHSARHSGVFGSAGMDQKENMLHFPNYMTATKSTKAKVRSQSAPKQRPGDPEKHSPAPPASRKRFSPSWADKLYYARRGSEEKTQFQRSVSQVRTRNRVSAACELMDNWSLRDECQYW